MNTLRTANRVFYKHCTPIALVLVLTAAPFCAGAATLWDEQGGANDLSFDFMNPTVLPTLTPGANDIFGDLDQASGDDDDFASFNVLTNQTVTQIILTGLSNPTSGAAMDFRLYNGPNATAPQLIGESLSDRDIGMYIFNLAGFPGPLTPGSYTLFLERSQNDNTVYGLSLTVIPLPLPIAMMGSALVALIAPSFMRRIGTS